MWACRWRKLEGSDPSTYEMIQKIQTLQKRLIGKTEEVVEKDLLIQVSVAAGLSLGLNPRTSPCRNSRQCDSRTGTAPCEHPSMSLIQSAGNGMVVVPTHGYARLSVWGLCSPSVSVKCPFIGLQFCCDSMCLTVSHLLW